MKFSRNVAWISFIVWIISCTILALFKANTIFWPVFYGYVILYLILVLVVNFYKFQKENYFRTPKGQVFGYVSFILLFIFIWEIAFAIFNIITRNQLAINISGMRPVTLFYTIVMNITRFSAYLFGIFLVINAGKSSEFKSSFKRTIVWILVSLAAIINFDFFIVQPLISQMIENFSPVMFTAAIFDLITPLANITFLLISLWVFIILTSKKHTRKMAGVVLGIIAVCIIDLVFIGINSKYYIQDISFITSFGYAVLILILSNMAIKAKLDIADIRLDLQYLSILSFIQNRPQCIKKDITQNFKITRMTTNQKLDRLSEFDLINISKSGRTRKISLSEKGVIFLKRS
ncbi:MAG: hypothetical protein KKF44_04090 [Nanoarchaeota archaeon]|nr:hypothetical protein [Nanoarchaeota archaeon]